MKQFVCTALVAAALTGTAYAQSKTNDGTIIWSNPETAGVSQAGATPAPGATKGAPDKNGIIWNDATSNAPPPPTPPRPLTSPPDAASAPRTFPSGTSASVQDDTVIWDTPPRRPGNAIAAAAQPGPCREFQTEIIIDGRKQPAHGTACRQPDGTWKVVNR